MFSDATLGDQMRRRVSSHRVPVLNWTCIWFSAERFQIAEGTSYNSWISSCANFGSEIAFSKRRKWNVQKKEKKK